MAGSAADGAAESVGDSTNTLKRALFLRIRMSATFVVNL